MKFEVSASGRFTLHVTEVTQLIDSPRIVTGRLSLTASGGFVVESEPAQPWGYRLVGVSRSRDERCSDLELSLSKFDGQGASMDDPPLSMGVRRIAGGSPTRFVLIPIPAGARGDPSDEDVDRAWVELTDAGVFSLRVFNPIRGLFVRECDLESAWRVMRGGEGAVGK